MTTTSTVTTGNPPAPPSPRSDAPGVRGLIARRPLISFFALAYGLSWLAWTPYVLSRSGMGILDFDFPALLGSTQLLGMLPGAYLGPIVSAFLVTAIAYGRAGVAAWLGRFKRWKVNWVWYAGVITGVPAVLSLGGLALSGEHGAQLPPITVLLAYLPMLLMQLVTTGLAEEPGWRDFALPHLQPRFGALGGSLILGPLWGCWHLPLFLSSWGGWPDVSILDVIIFVLTAMAICIVMTWVFNRTGQSLPLQMIVHSSINTYASVVWPAVFPGMGHDTVTHGLLLATGLAAVTVLLLTRGRLGGNGPAFGPRHRAVGR